MSDKTQNESFAWLYDDFDTGNYPEVKPLLAHYTSIESLEGIVQNSEIWLSNPLFMNDLEEVRFGIEQGVSAILRSSRLSKCFETPMDEAMFRNQLDQCYRAFVNEHAFDTYVFCLSEHNSSEDSDGRLSMWRGYGGKGGGAAIVFDTASLGIPPVDTPLVLGKVTYDTNEIRATWINTIVDRLLTRFTYVRINSQNCISVAFHLFERLKLFALFNKHAGFSEEREWRVVYRRDRDQNKEFDKFFHYCLGPNGIEPKLKLKIDAIPSGSTSPTALQDIVQRIILGPHLSSPLAVATVKRLLQAHGSHELSQRVHPSLIPFRKS